MAESKPSFIDYGVAKLTFPGEGQSGDSYVVKERPGGAIIAVVDGLGHGEEASVAASLAASIIEANPGETVLSLIARCHERLRGGRGAALTIVSIDALTRTLSWAGVGNVEGVLVHAAATEGKTRREYVQLRGGIVGRHLPTLHPSATHIGRGDMLILATDGVRRDFLDDINVELSPQAFAERTLRRYALNTDDALILAARFLGGN